MKKSIGICMIVCLMSLPVHLALAAEEQTLREELETHRSRTEVSYEKYRDELEKILNPRKWDADLRYVLFPLGAIALGVVIIFFVRQIRMNLISEAHDDVTEAALEQVVDRKGSTRTRRDSRGCKRLSQRTPFPLPLRYFAPPRTRGTPVR